MIFHTFLLDFLPFSGVSGGPEGGGEARGMQVSVFPEYGPVISHGGPNREKCNTTFL